jgi:hypothetical protein
MASRFIRATSLMIAALPLILPTAAFAYLSPEQVFGGSSITLNSPPPPTLREGESVVQAQQQVSAERRALEQSSMQPVNAEPQDVYVAPTVSKNLLNDETQYDIRMQRKATEVTNAPTIIIGGQGTVVDSNGNVLHSGAPLVTSTGPETAFAAAAMVLAAISTLAFAILKSRRLMLQTSTLS